MAKYLDLLGLTTYDLAIKLYIDNSTPESITSAEIEELFNNGDIPGGHSAGGDSPTDNNLYWRTGEGTGTCLVNAEGKLIIASISGDNYCFFKNSSGNIPEPSTTIEARAAAFGGTAEVTFEGTPPTDYTITYNEHAYGVNGDSWDTVQVWS